MAGDSDDPEGFGLPFEISDEMTELEAILDRAYEAMDSGDFDSAREAFRQALERAPASPEPHNYLGLIALEEGDNVAAEQEYAAARMLAAQALGPGFGSAHWWIDERTRPYLKATLGLALACSYQDRFPQAERHVAEILRLNPTDNLGCRYLLAELLLRRGDASGASRAFEDAEPAPGSHFSAALAKLAEGKPRDAALVLREAFFTNIYIPPLLIGASAPVRFRAKANNRAAEIDAQAFERRAGDLWAGKDAERACVRRLWDDPEVRGEVVRYVELVDRLNAEPDGGKRDAILEELESLRRPGTLARNHEAICRRAGV